MARTLLWGSSAGHRITTGAALRTRTARNRRISREQPALRAQPLIHVSSRDQAGDVGVAVRDGHGRASLV